MNDKKLHELAIAYAQVKLLLSHKELEKSGDNNSSEEIRLFAKYYQFALENLENEYDSIG